MTFTDDIILRMKTRRSSDQNKLSMERPIKRSRTNETIMVPTRESGKPTDTAEEVYLAWSPVRIIRIPEK